MSAVQIIAVSAKQFFSGKGHSIHIGMRVHRSLGASITVPPNLAWATLCWHSDQTHWFHQLMGHEYQCRTSPQEDVRSKHLITSEQG